MGCPVLPLLLDPQIVLALLLGSALLLFPQGFQLHVPDLREGPAEISH
jgi:hypothetical protein